MEPGSESTEDFSGYLLAQEVLCGFLVLSLVAVCAGLLYQALALSRLLRRERHVRQFAPRAGLGMPEADLQRLLSHPAPCGPGGEGHNECCVCLQEIAPSSPSLQLLKLILQNVAKLVSSSLGLKTVEDSTTVVFSTTSRSEKNTRIQFPPKSW